MRRVRIQPRGLVTSVPGGDVGHNLFIWKLWKVRAHQDVGLEVMQERQYSNEYWDERILRDWSDSVGGGLDWWSTGEDVEGSGEVNGQGIFGHAHERVSLIGYPRFASVDPCISSRTSR